MAARGPRHVRLAVTALTVLLGALVLPGGRASVLAQERVPVATLSPAPSLSLPGGVDSNSPAVWDLVRGRERLFVITSVDGQPSISSGLGMGGLGMARPVTFTPHPGHGVWMEAVLTDAVGTWYGYYHNEVPAVWCNREDRVRPRIGAARSTNRGRTWQDLGIILEAPPGTDECSSGNRYFVGGVGDLSVALDRDQNYLYVFFSQYGREPEGQGVAVGRMPWAFRDQPEGRLDIWSGDIWLPASASRAETTEEVPGLAAGAPTMMWRYPAGTPLVQPERPWHDSDPGDDGFWGPSVHWNSGLQMYVMLLNRTADDDFTQAGIYISYADTLDDPTRWSAPVLLLEQGPWYPQVLGFDSGSGTDKEAGAQARFFLGGESHHFIAFGFK